MTTFLVATFLTLTPRKPLRNLTVVVTLVFLFNAVYEFVYAIFYDLL
jgi:hypothetical protein